MRIWSLHPQYLDAKGLVALWRETLLAKKVLEGNTRGYSHHPQLNRFKTSGHPLERVNQYLAAVYEEATRRGYVFDRNKIDWNFQPAKMPVTSGQIQYETRHLLKKLQLREPERVFALLTESLELHPLFRLIDGDIEPWEIIRTENTKPNIDH